MSTKKCCRCKRVKDITEFGKNRSAKDGLAWECNQCCKETQATDKYKERHKQYEVNHREARRINRKKYVARIKATGKRWCDAHPTYKTEYNRVWRATHPEQVKINRDNHRALDYHTTGKHTIEEWVNLCNQYGNRCLRCGRTDVKLTKDHVIPLSKGGSNDIGNLQPLCHSCNCSKQGKIQDFRY